MQARRAAPWEPRAQRQDVTQSLGHRDREGAQDRYVDHVNNGTGHLTRAGRDATYPAPFPALQPASPTRQSRNSWGRPAHGAGRRRECRPQGPRLTAAATGAHSTAPRHARAGGPPPPAASSHPFQPRKSMDLNKHVHTLTEHINNEINKHMKIMKNHQERLTQLTTVFFIIYFSFWSRSMLFLQHL